LFQEGDEGGEDGLYIVLRGSVDVWKKKKLHGSHNRRRSSGGRPSRRNSNSGELLHKPSRRGDWYNGKF
tara:strand:+ start:69 stop:275 length:207 start_codon:yes stop_codon:yes gene_type:complete